jgi:hypothetical protein
LDGFSRGREGESGWDNADEFGFEVGVDCGNDLLERVYYLRVGVRDFGDCWGCGVDGEKAASNFEESVVRFRVDGIGGVCGRFIFARLV